MDNDKDSKNLIRTRNKVIYFFAIATSGPIFLLMRYMQQGRLGWLDFVGAGGGVVIGFIAFTLGIWYFNQR